MQYISEDGIEDNVRDGYNALRGFKANKTGIIFYDAHYNDVIQNGTCIPLKIYGLK